MLEQHVTIIISLFTLTPQKNYCESENSTSTPCHDGVTNQLNTTETTPEEPSDEPSFFEMLDDAIFQSLSNPKPGSSNKLFADIEMFHNCLERVKRMFLEMEGEKIESLRSSVIRLYSTRGGPTFTRFPIDNTENKRKLIDAFKWNDDNFKKLYELQEKLENVWYSVRHIVI